MRNLFFLPRHRLASRIGTAFCTGLAAAFFAFAAQAGDFLDEGDAEAPMRPAEIGVGGQGTSVVDQSTGAFTHSIPIAVPAYHGLEPSMALDYQSITDNGLLGVGWSLAGLSEIRLVSKGKGVPSFTSSDIYVLDGQELVSCTTSSTSPSCKNRPASATAICYSTKIENYERICRDGGVWTRWSKNGTRSIYATTLKIGTTTTRWLLSERRDAHNNVVGYSYASYPSAGTGDSWTYPTKISYNNNSIEFYLEPRTDKVSAADGAGLANMAYRLKLVEVKAGTSRVRAYELNYAQTAASKISVLQSVRQFGNTATVAYSTSSVAPTTVTISGSSLPPSTFGWNAEASMAFGAAAVDGSAWCGLSSLQLTDINGDGKVDLFCRRSNGTKSYRLGDGTGSFQTGIASEGYNCGPSGYEYKLADFNGDGVQDCLSHYDNTVAVFLGAFNGGISPTFGLLSAPIVDDSKWCRNNATEEHYLLVADVNGDGLPDLFCHNSSVGSHGNQVRLGDGMGHFGAVIDSGESCSDARIVKVADFNGDGKADCYSHAQQKNKVFLGYGNGRFAPVITDNTTWCDTTNGLAAVLMSDANGDGKADLVCHARLTPFYNHVRLGDGAGHFGTTTLITGTCGNANMALPDINGDGKSDCFFLNGAGKVSVALENSTTIPTSIATVTTPLGGTQSVTYASSTTWSNNLLPFNVLTVASALVGDGRGTAAATSYTYSGGRYLPSERRFLGFSEVQALGPCLPYEDLYTAPPPCPIVVTTYRQSNASAGKPERVDVWVDAKLMGSTLYQYTESSATAPYTSLLTGTWQFSYDGLSTTCPGIHCKRTRTSTSYDAFANAVSVVSYGECDGTSAYPNCGTTGDESLASTSYLPNNPTAYLVGLPTVQRLYSGTSVAASALLAESLVAYDQQGVAIPDYAKVPVLGDATQTKKWLKESGAYITAKQEFDLYGNVTKSIDEVGNAITTGYDSTYHVYPTTSTNALSQTATTTPNFVCGLPASTVGLNGATDATATTYDEFCRVSRVDSPMGGFRAESYGDYGDPTRQYLLVQTPSADGVGNQWVKTYFDGLSRPYKVSSKGVGQEVINQVTYYNLRGMVSSISEHYTTNTPKFQKFTYDSLDRIARVKNLDATIRSTAYQLWTTTNTDELGNTASTVKDAFGRVVLRRASVAGIAQSTSFTYDVAGHLKGIADPEGNVWTRTYDSLGRLISDRDPDRGTWTYTYYDNGLVKTQTDSKAQVTTFTYDSLKRKKSEVAGSGAGTITKSWKYDEQRVGYFNLGRLTSMADGSGSATMDYDLAGRQSKLVKTIGATAFTFTQGYDAGGRLKWTTYPDNDTAGTASSPLIYDGAGNMSAIPSVVASATYTPWGAPSVVNFSNGVTTTYGYDTNHALSSVTTTKGTITPPTLQSLTYQRDVKGRIYDISSATPTDGFGWSYTYDEIDQLKNATNKSNTADNQTFTYSASGNILTNSRLTGTYTYPTPGSTAIRPHATTQAGGVNYGYDNNGNMTSKGLTTYTFDAANRLVAVGSVTFDYDADNQRVKKALAGNTSLYPRGDYRVLNGTATKHIKLGSLLVATRKGTTTSWLHGDHLGSASVMTNSVGTEVLRMRHRPFGERFNASTAVEEESDFIGERRDAETGLVYQRSRYYDPVLARYTAADSLDPAKPSVGVNRYAFALNDPVNKRDDGREAFAIKLGATKFDQDKVSYKMWSLAFPGVAPGPVPIPYFAEGSLSFGSDYRKGPFLSVASKAAIGVKDVASVGLEAKYMQYLTSDYPGLTTLSAVAAVGKRTEYISSPILSSGPSPDSGRPDAVHSISAPGSYLDQLNAIDAYTYGPFGQNPSLYAAFPNCCQGDNGSKSEEGFGDEFGGRLKRAIPDFDEFSHFDFAPSFDLFIDDSFHFGGSLYLDVQDITYDDEFF